jgi:hypothetical protein
MKPAQKRPLRRRLSLLLLAAAIAGACSTSPTVVSERTTLGAVDMAGMECRVDTPPDTNVPRTICASPEQWAALDRKERAVADQVFDSIRETPNGRFSTPR